jgi:hypothetical protein
LTQLAGLEAPTHSQLAQGKGDHSPAGGAELDVAVELGDTQGTGGAGRALTAGAGMGLQRVMGVGQGLAVHRVELQGHGTTADATGYPDRSLDPLTATSRG